MTWGEFKEMVEKAGVKDDCEVNFIDHDSIDVVDGIEVYLDKKSNCCQIQPK